MHWPPSWASPGRRDGALRNVEEALGAAHGLADGKYLEAMASVCPGDAAHLSALDGEVARPAAGCSFAPRYAQYLALMLFAHWVDAQLVDAAAFLARV